MTMTGTTESALITAAPTCADRLSALAGRDRAVATRLRDEAAKLLRLAEALEANSGIANAAAADMLVE